MGSAQKIFALGQAGWKRRMDAQMENPGAPVSYAAADPGWDAFFEGLREAESNANAEGRNFRVNGSPGQPSLGKMGGFTQRPGDEDVARNIIANSDPSQDVRRRDERISLLRMQAEPPPESVPMQQARPILKAPDGGYVTGAVPVAPPTLEQLKQAEVERHNRATEAAANPFGQAAPQAGVATGSAATDVNGEDFLKTIPKGLASEVKAYAEGRRPFPSGMALKSPYFQQMLQAVGQYDPSFDAVNYNARNKAFSDLTSPNGTGGKTINAMNTAMQHIGKLSDLVETLDNYDTPILNAVRNPIEKAFGSTKVTNFDAVQPQAMKEIERLWRGAGGSAGEIEQLKQSLGSGMGKQQQREALANFAELMLGKLDATQQQRDNALGPVAAAKIPILFDQNRAALTKIYERAGLPLPEGVRGRAPAASAAGEPSPEFGAPVEGAQKPIPGVPGSLAVYTGGKWIRKQ